MMPRPNEELWYTDRISDAERHEHRIRRWVVRKKTEHQSVAVIDSVTFGKCLVIDNDLQSSETDEFIYHEALVHPAMILHGNPQNVLILGGGEGATLREVLKYRSVKTATMVDIDAEVIRFCREFVPGHSAGAFDDPRSRLIITDARQFIKETPLKYDVIISDLCSPVVGGPACLLYTSEFYKILVGKFASGGVFSAQIDACSLVNLNVATTIYKTISSVFPAARLYTGHIPSFDSVWGFCVASVDPKNLELSETKINARISDLVTGGLRFYDAETHRGMFAQPRYLREAIAAQQAIITEANPIFIYK